MNNKKEKTIVSDCCGTGVQYTPNFLGMENICFCNKCDKPCKPVIKK